MELIRPDRPSACTWKPNANNTPHTQRTEPNNRNAVLPSILHAIGQTPLIQLNNIPESYGIKCEIYVKCEFLNPGGSVKDRIAYRMVQDAEDKGILKPGSTIIEPTSGNTGIGLAMAAAVKGYRCIIVMPEKMSNEKVYTLRALGAEIVRTPTEASWHSPEGHISVSQKLQREIPNSVILDQYTNPGNPLAHYDETAMEIWKQCNGKIDYLVAGAGTGGTVSGIGRKLKELSPETKIIAADPKGSILARPLELNKGGIGFYEVEGIGYDFIPTVLDHNVIDMWIKTNDQESLNAARSLIRKEGLLCGGSSGSALAAALQISRGLPESKRVVVLLPDGIRNYMTKFVSDHWMLTRGFLDILPSNERKKWWYNTPLSNLCLSKPLMLSSTTTCQEAAKIFQASKASQLLISDNGMQILGVVLSDTLFGGLISGIIDLKETIKKAMTKQYTKTILSTTLGRLSHIMQEESYAVVLDDARDNAVVGIVNQMDIFNFINDSKAKINGST